MDERGALQPKPRVLLHAFLSINSIVMVLHPFKILLVKLMTMSKKNDFFNICANN